MAVLHTNEISIAYDDVGPREGSAPVILLHGFASNRTENWRRVGWLSAFERRGMRAIAFDIRGHGESGKPHEPSAYSQHLLIADVIGVMDALGVGSGILMGYSMGARLAAETALMHPQRFERLVLGGAGGRWFTPSPAGNPMAAAMEAPDSDAITDLLLRSFRHFADEQGQDRQALAAFARVPRTLVHAEALQTLQLPTLVVAGARDTLAGSPEELAAHIRGARAVSLPGCDHFSTIAHALFKAAVFDFLEET